MKRGMPARWPSGLAALTTLLLALMPGAAAACAIDNVASLLADGVPAMLTTSAPHGTTSWAPFTIAQAIACGASVRLAEAPADLARTLPPAVRLAPVSLGLRRRGRASRARGGPPLRPRGDLPAYRLWLRRDDAPLVRLRRGAAARRPIRPGAARQPRVRRAARRHRPLRGHLARRRGDRRAGAGAARAARARGTVAGRSRRARPRLGVRAVTPREQQREGAQGCLYLTTLRPCTARVARLTALFSGRA